MWRYDDKNQLPNVSGFLDSKGTQKQKVIDTKINNIDRINKQVRTVIRVHTYDRKARECINA